MHFVERGTGTPVVFFHGFGPDHRSLLPFDPVFERHGGWRRIYPDLPGMGRTPAGSDLYGTEAVARTAATFVRERVGANPFALVGNSYGGVIARRLARDYRSQVLGLCLIAPVTVAETADRILPKRQVVKADPELLRSLPTGIGEMYSQVSVEQNRANFDAFAEYVVPGAEVADQEALARIRAAYALAVEPEVVDPEPFDRPTLFITGRQDHIVGYADAWALQDNYLRATFLVLDAAGHLVQFEKPEMIVAAIEDWLTRMRST